MPDEIRNTFNILHNIAENVFYVIVFILPQISNTFWGEFLETETLSAGSISNKFSQYFLNLGILSVYINLTQICIIILKHLGQAKKSCTAST